MRRSFAREVPVQEAPYPPQVRSAIAEVIRDHSPITLGTITVERRTADWATILYALPNGERGHREVELEEPWHL